MSTERNIQVQGGCAVFLFYFKVESLALWMEKMLFTTCSWIKRLNRVEADKFFTIPAIRLFGKLKATWLHNARTDYKNTSAVMKRIKTLMSGLIILPRNWRNGADAAPIHAARRRRVRCTGTEKCFLEPNRNS